MEIDREIDETVARCVASVVYYRNCGRTPRAREVFEADASGVAARIDQLRLLPDEADRLVLHPVLAALLERYDRAQALLLYGEFVSALYPKAPAVGAGPLACRN